MTKSALIELIQKQVPDGAEVGITDGNTISIDLKIKKTRATKPGENLGLCWQSNYGHFAIYVIEKV